MTRRSFGHAAALSVLVALTVPLLALLCRGHAPSRFAASNLPFWQRALPHPARLAVALRRPPAAPGTVRYDALPLGDVNEDRLLAGLEHPSKMGDAGRAGQWLEAACALGRDDAHLRRAQDDVAERLMDAQDADGYLASGRGAVRWHPAQAAAFGHNLRGLLAFYALTRGPAALYAAMQAGDLVVSEVSPAPNAVPDGLLQPMTRLFLATGEPRYRAWALGTAPFAATDGPGLCAAYGLTGQGKFLRAAERLWQQQTAAGHADAELASALWTVTGEPAYLAAGNAAAPWVCPLSDGTLTYSHTSSTLSVNALTPSRATFGAVGLTQRVTVQRGKRTVEVSVRVARPAAFTLQLFVPTGPGPARLSAPGATRAVTVPRGTFWESKRSWRDGDTVALAFPEPAAAPTTRGRS